MASFCIMRCFFSFVYYDYIDIVGDSLGIGVLLEKIVRGKVLGFWCVSFIVRSGILVYCGNFLGFFLYCCFVGYCYSVD